MYPNWAPNTRYSWLPDYQFCTGHIFDLAFCQKYVLFTSLCPNICCYFWNKLWFKFGLQVSSKFIKPPNLDKEWFDFDFENLEFPHCQPKLIQITSKCRVGPIIRKLSAKKNNLTNFTGGYSIAEWPRASDQWVTNVTNGSDFAGVTSGHTFCEDSDPRPSCSVCVLLSLL